MEVGIRLVHLHQEEYPMNHRNLGMGGCGGVTPGCSNAWGTQTFLQVLVYVRLQRVPGCSPILPQGKVKGIEWELWHVPSFRAFRSRHGYVELLLSVLQELNRDKSDGNLSYCFSLRNANQLDPGWNFQGASLCLEASSWSVLPLGLHGCQTLNSECKGLHS